MHNIYKRNVEINKQKYRNRSLALGRFNNKNLKNII